MDLEAATKAFVEAENAEIEASNAYHATTPRAEHSAERYVEHMAPFWDASAKAYEVFRRAGGRLGA